MPLWVNSTRAAAYAQAVGAPGRRSGSRMIAGPVTGRPHPQFRRIAKHLYFPGKP